MRPWGSIATALAGALLALPGGRSRPPSPLTLPPPPAPSAPAKRRLDGGVSGPVLTETESCAGCHADAAAQWASSAHAFASFNNPIYRVVVDAYRARVGRDKSRFCAGCHDVALL